ncbi:MAG: toll/interleukin-1 receptor domain-containing protein [Lachnospiraceae bacterium]|nr:toll/interleukin-1 receptor domain-containing protein [Lachnospiraceae bacterium]
MALCKCKMCGGDLEIMPGATVAECIYCGSTQTIPVYEDEKKLNLFNRANELRRANEFDKAAGIYETIIADFPGDPEGYWGNCLCRYGIEYVDDPYRNIKIPTCHRTLYQSILEDPDFRQLISIADQNAASLYQKEAREIDRLQKEILMSAGQRQPVDIFICYKESDDFGQRTQDSVAAQEIYDALTAKGYRVFFARISLENMAGEAYEPIIFSALHSAKVMLAIGSSRENFESVWVRNEWSRYLEIMRAERDRQLIPCYFNMDASELPQEFTLLPAQDMSQMGFLQELVRGIGKLLPAEQKTAGETPEKTVSEQLRTLLNRADKNWEAERYDNAYQIYENALDEDIECGPAYMGLFLCSYGLGPKELTMTDARFTDAAGRGRDNVLDLNVINDHLEILDDEDLARARKYADEKTKERIAQFESMLRLKAEQYGKPQFIAKLDGRPVEPQTQSPQTQPEPDAVSAGETGRAVSQIRGPVPETRGPVPETGGALAGTRGPVPKTAEPSAETRGPVPETNGPVPEKKRRSILPWIVIIVIILLFLRLVSGCRSCLRNLGEIPQERLQAEVSEEYYLAEANA